jgi:hypothetical protein
MHSKRKMTDTDYRNVIMKMGRRIQILEKKVELLHKEVMKDEGRD